MNQYERIVSYIHQYQEGIKGANVGYARIEKRGDSCRIQVQMRSNYLNKNPQLYLYKQLDRTIRTALVGEMPVKGNEVYYKGSSEVAGVFGSELSLDEVDGLLLYLNQRVYFATSWKNDSIHLGDWRSDREDKLVSSDNISGREENSPGEMEAVESGEEQSIQAVRKREYSEESGETQAQVPEQEAVERQEERAENVGENRRDTAEENRLNWYGPDRGENTGQREETAEILRENVGQREEATDIRKDNAGIQGEVEVAETAQVQMQAICGVCPFKRQNMDYGKRILSSFPTMRPFPEEKASECVRLELQDIGCLPMRYWSLSGNRFLLHGYYCYRHLIFCRREKGKYVLGVPGIYSEREQKNAARFGFPSFQSIGEFGKQRGAFGYWFMELM